MCKPFEKFGASKFEALSLANKALQSEMRMSTPSLSILHILFFFANVLGHENTQCFCDA